VGGLKLGISDGGEKHRLRVNMFHTLALKGYFKFM
jgi:hypothetical protein